MSDVLSSSYVALPPAFDAQPEEQEPTMLTCGCEDSEYLLALPEALFKPSAGTEFCLECGRLIPYGEDSYRVLSLEYNEDGEETLIADRPCCEQCGDLALSLLELGYCWTFGDLRQDVADLHDWNTKPRRL